MSDVKEDPTKKKTTFKTPQPEGVWDSIFRRLCELNYGCCCCGTLRTGTLIFAWFFLFWFLFETFGSIMVACTYYGWYKVDFLLAQNDIITHFHKADPFFYIVMALLQFSLSVVLLIAVFKESNMRFNFIRIFIQSFFVLIIVGTAYEAAKFVAFVSLNEANRLRIYGSLLGFMAVQGVYGWGTIVVKCYYVDLIG